MANETLVKSIRKQSEAIRDIHKLLNKLNELNSAIYTEISGQLDKAIMITKQIKEENDK